MTLLDFANKILSDAVDAFCLCSQGEEEKAVAQLFEIARKIQDETPAAKPSPAPTPEQGGF